MKKLITVLTPTYNRAHLLPDLYYSLCRQTSHQFDWIIVDDGSTDETELIVNKWLATDNSFHIEYFKKENGGKNRAINDGVKLVRTPFTMIVDSDDYLTDDAIDFLSNAARKIEDDAKLAGVAGLRGTDEHTPLKEPLISPNGSVLATNLERDKYRLDCDACEVYKTSALVSHPFRVWQNEKFVPEQVVWNLLALEGYSIRWYNRVTYIARYQHDGMTNDSWNLLKGNPMGYAMMFNQNIQTTRCYKAKVNNTLQFVSCCFIGKKPSYIFKCNSLFLGIMLCVPGWLLSKRRQTQFEKYTHNI